MTDRAPGTGRRRSFDPQGRRALFDTPVSAARDTIRSGIPEGTLPAGPVTWTWDGLNDAGEPANEGTYTSIVTVTRSSIVSPPRAPFRGGSCRPRR